MISKSFIEKFISRMDKIDSEQLKTFMERIVSDLELFLMLMEQAPEGMVLFTPTGDVEYANKKAAELFRFENREEMQGKKLEEVIYTLELRNTLKRKMKIQEAIFDEEHIMGMPLIRVMRVNFYPIRDQSNTVIFFVLRFKDITRKKLEEIKNRRKENIESMRHLAAGVAHEIKNPLASIDIHIKLLSRLLGKAPAFDDKENMHSFLDILQEEVVRLNTIVQDFLASIRPVSLDLRKVDLKDLMEELIRFLSLELKEKNIQISLSIEDNLPPIMGDQKYLRICFLNLVKNAMEAFLDGQEERKLDIKISENAPFVEVLVKDNGRGIPSHKLEKIFEPYFSTKSSGTGIGLTLVHKTITEHNGNIKVNSEDGKGTEFIVMLPQYAGETQKFLDSGKPKE